MSDTGKLAIRERDEARERAEAAGAKLAKANAKLDQYDERWDLLDGDVASVVKLYDEAEAKLAAVRELHKPFDDDGVKYCGWDRVGGCGEVWPCSTIRAIDGEESR